MARVVETIGRSARASSLFSISSVMATLYLFIMFIHTNASHAKSEKNP